MSRPLVALFAIVLASSALAQADLRVSEAIRLYDGGEFAKAKDTLVTVVESPRLTTAQRSRARVYLAASYYALGDIASAKAQLLSLAREDREARIDPALFVPELVALLDDARAEVAAETPPTPPVVEPVKPEIKVEPTVVAPTVVEPKPPEPKLALTPARPPLAMAFIPFGVGQFANGQQGKGIGFLAGETMLFGISLATLLLFESEKVDGQFLSWGSFRDVPRAQSLQALYLATFYGGLLLTGAGMVDAMIFRPAGAHAELTVGPTSIQVRF